MSREDPAIVVANPWQELRRFTRARIALGRSGNSLPTDEVLRFGLAHAQARDAVHVPLDVSLLRDGLESLGYPVLHAASRASDRQAYLLRPDCGRRLSGESVAALDNALYQPCDLLFVLADGLSPQAVQRHALPVLARMEPLLRDGWRVGPVVVATQARVALGDEIGALLRAEIVAVMIGERPGLTSPDSLGIYLTYAPRVGRTDAERHCISNIRPEGLPYPTAARELHRLLERARRFRASGIALKAEATLKAETILKAEDDAVGQVQHESGAQVSHEGQRQHGGQQGRP